MKTTLIALAAALVLSALPAAHAQDATPQIKVGAPQAHAGYVVTPGQFADFANTYRLANGQKVVFSQFGNRYYAQVDHGKRVRIQALSENEFVTAQGTQIVFRDYGDEVGISNFDKLPMAQALPGNTWVVARR
ncbi:MAG: gel scht [Duganella sp.]